MDFSSTTIAAVVGWTVAEHADVEALVDGDVRMTYREMGERIDVAARALIGSGIEPGDAVAVWAPNVWEWVVSGLAVFRAGGVMVPVNTRFKGREAAYVLGKAEVKLLLTVNGFLDTDYVAMLRLSDIELPHLGDIVVMRGDLPEGVVGFDEFLARSEGVDQAEVDRRSAATTPDDTGLIMFTSGTTGLPKGVMVANGAIPRAFWSYAESMGVEVGDPYLVMNPFFHAFGFNGGIMACIMKGGTVVALAVFDVAEVCSIIERERIARWPGPPAVFQGLLNFARLDEYDLSSLKGCITGAAAIPVEMIHQMNERLGFERIITAYGMTETSGLASICRGDESPELLSGSSGCAIPDVELKIVGPAGDELPRGEAGELMVKGFNVMKGYLGDAEQTAATIEPDGWMHTGDIAVMDEQGYIDITDRMKDMFINGGFNAYPAEIEAVMIEHPDIGQVAVIGIPDDRLGEVGAAFVVAAPDSSPTEADLISWCREEMANYKVPRHIWLVDALPLNPSNKVLKTDLRDQAAKLLKT